MKIIIFLILIVTALFIVGLGFLTTKFKIWEYVWFQKFILWCRKWEWFDDVVYGAAKETSLMDFVRNPMEGLENYYLSFNNVKAYKIFTIRFGCIKYDPNKVPEYENKIVAALGDTINDKWQKKLFVATYRDLGIKRGIQPWITKYVNARFSFVLNCCVWKGWLPLLFFGISFRTSETRYFQIGMGFGAEGKITNTNIYERATFSAKFRTADFVKEWTEGLNYDVYGYYEGII